MMNSAEAGGAGTILLIAHDRDEHADELIASLRGHDKGAEVVRVARDHLPAVTFSATPGTVVSIGEAHFGRDRRVAGFWRRPAWPEVSAYTRDTQAFTHDECVDAFDGALESLPINWVTHPAALRSAELKVRQLAVARGLGVCTPRTLVTNDPARAQPFARSLPAIIAKPVRYGLLSTERPRVAWTRQISVGDLKDLSGPPIILQELVTADLHIRCITVGANSYTAVLSTRDTDWRRNLANHDRFAIADSDLSRQVHEGAVGIAAALRLGYSAQDWILTSRGDLYFLEANPSGQWLFLDSLWGGGITDAMAHRLVQLLGGDTP